MTIYLDCNATTPIDPEVMKVVRHYMEVEFGNAGSRTHEYGARAKKAVEEARAIVAEEVGVRQGDVIFTSGATESNNLAILGLEAEGRRTRKMHLISSKIEHKSVLEPLAEMGRRGFEVTLLQPEPTGAVAASALRAALRADTLLVSLMHVNNETGVVQDIDGYCDVLADHDAYLHVDAAQSFARLSLKNPRIDIVSLSGHKIGATKGIGALGLRRRKWASAPLKPLVFGGGQEGGLRPGTVAVPLVAGLGEAVHQWSRNRSARLDACRARQSQLVDGLRGSSISMMFAQEVLAPWVAPLILHGVDTEAALVRLRSALAVSNGAACTSNSYAGSHVLEALGVANRESFMRLSWGPGLTYEAMAEALTHLRGVSLEAM